MAQGEVTTADFNHIEAQLYVNGELVSDVVIDREETPTTVAEMAGPQRIYDDFPSRHLQTPPQKPTPPDIVVIREGDTEARKDSDKKLSDWLLWGWW